MTHHRKLQERKKNITNKVSVITLEISIIYFSNGSIVETDSSDKRYIICIHALMTSITENIYVRR